MKKFYYFLPVFIFSASITYGQAPEKKLPAKPAEQKEIIANDHLRKELEQKQLLASPERIADSLSSKPAIKGTGKKHKRTHKKDCLKKSE